MKRKLLLTSLLIPTLLMVGCGYTEDNGELIQGISDLSIEKYTDKETGKRYIIFESGKGYR